MAWSPDDTLCPACELRGGWVLILEGVDRWARWEICTHGGER